MKRAVISDLVKWKDHKRRKPLLLTGVRQCGKTYALKEFGENYFENVIYVNFEESNRVRGIFDFDYDTDRIIRELELQFRSKIIPGRSLLIFDEVQECPRAITSLKYFCENKRELHLVCAGSLLGVAIKAENVSFPVGKVNRLSMYPMSFREFLEACSGEKYTEIFESWDIERPIPDLYDVPMKKMLKEYYLVGGMPEAVQTWIETSDISEVEMVQDEILKDYSDDFSKHAPTEQVEKIRWIWDSLPVQLAKDNNKFMFSHVKKGKRAAELEAALHWLCDAGLAYKTELVENPEIPLSSFSDSTYFKLYASDTGLLRKRAGVTSDTILFGDTQFISYKGALTENYVLNELKAMGCDAYFWRSGNTAEVDFLTENNGKVIPIEVKSADNVRAKSFTAFCKKYKPDKGIKASLKNIGVNKCDDTTAVNLPLYLLWNMNFFLK